jgi:hypothetical protein
MNLTVSPNMDRETTEQAQLSLNFIDFIVTPLYVALSNLFPKFQLFCENLKSNRAEWEQLRSRKLEAEQEGETAKQKESKKWQKRTSAFDKILMPDAAVEGAKEEQPPQKQPRSITPTSRRNSLDALKQFVEANSPKTNTGLEEKKELQGTKVSSEASPGKLTTPESTRDSRKQSTPLVGRLNQTMLVEQAAASAPLQNVIASPRRMADEYRSSEIRMQSNPMTSNPVTPAPASNRLSSRLRADFDGVVAEPIEGELRLAISFKDGVCFKEKLERRRVYSIGRAKTNDIQLIHDLSISRNHCQISIDSEGRTILVDKKSTTGTKLNGKSVKYKAALSCNDVIELGTTKIAFYVKNKKSVGTFFSMLSQIASDGSEAPLGKRDATF